MSQPWQNFKKLQNQNIFKQQKIQKDPFLFTNRIIREQIKNERLFNLVVPLGLHIIANVILQPLNVVGTLLQLSVKEHANLYNTQSITKYNQMQDLGARSKIQTTAVTKINKDITMTQKKKMQLQILSGGKHKPFTAPVYTGYKSVIRDLYNQGFQSFFKGLMSTSLLQFYRSSFRYGIISPYLYRNNGRQNVISTLAISYCALTFCDIILNYMHMTESRFILQSRLPEFSTYKNIRQFVLNNWGVKRWMTNGWKTHFIRNLFIIPIGVNASNQMFLITFLLSYPINTAYKRILCQSPDAGMITHRYGSVWHALRLIFQQQGLKGIYRGGIAHGIREFALFNFFKISYTSIVASQNSDWMSVYKSKQYQTRF